ncbi:flagellin [Bacillus xiapuensis]|uniref:flagellin n=1 Tax=Bacillus xiapuensis TaxID=2014075 RepID=UPI000C2320D0|nr:flagellin [Bacillus xiapuensis]
MKLHNQTMIAFSVTRYQKNDRTMEKTIDKLSTGLAIRRASDNAAGLAVSETIRAQVRGLSQAQRNMQDGLSVLQAANEGLNNVNGLLQRGRELAVMSANETMTAEDRKASQAELDELLKAIDDTAQKLEFNTKKILGENAPLILMVGANPGQKLTVDLVDTSTSALNLTQASVLTSESAEQLIQTLDEAIIKTTGNLTKIGSYYEAIEHHMANTMVKETNLTSSLSKLVDTDMAKEMMNYISQDIRQNSDQLIVSRINQSAGDALKLFNS